MKSCSIKGAVDSIESMGLTDGPGIRTVIFLSGCKLRCKYCHNPEMWTKGKENMTVDELVSKILRFRPYYGEDGGVTFSGGEPLMQKDFLIACCKELHRLGISIALDTAGVGVGAYEEILENIDVVIYDIKHLDRDAYQELTGYPIEESLYFLEVCQRLQKPLWIRQVIVPGLHNKMEYIIKLKKYIASLQNVEKVEFLPYHTRGVAKYRRLGIPYLLEGVPEMDVEKCAELYRLYQKLDV